MKNFFWSLFFTVELVQTAPLSWRRCWQLSKIWLVEQGTEYNPVLAAQSEAHFYS